ncbi:response regulator receiver domain protein [Rhizoctonia solani AG-3 Rhs1AP]|uniref:Response regulator receiver domain protein n=1 Tax=Rhizoctonia solani AG-3 Rhs1AP TaxID=1086054 RepID=X8JDE1_9AGAM|nr:response regulator receiver domain protein [Rhizoctonia solani AG-3 Rhs1AP]
MLSRCVRLRMMSTASTSPTKLVPPFTEETALAKVKAAQNLWNGQDPEKIALAYTPDSIWRNRSSFLQGRPAIVEMLKNKWVKEKDYMLRKELFSFTDNRIAVQFWYEYRDALDGMKWKRCYGLEDWTYAEDGLMRKRQMSGNDIEIKEGERWFKGLNKDQVESVDISEQHWQMRDNLSSIVDSLPYLTSAIPQLPLLDVEGGLFGGGDGGVVGVKNFRISAQKDIDGLDNYISQHLDTSGPLPPLSTNAPYILAVWSEIIAACPIQAVGRTFNLPKEKGRGKDAATVKVDVVADEGRRWIRVNTIKNSRLMAEIHELDGYDSESSEENSPQNGNIVSPSGENSIIRMARSLLVAAKYHVVPDTGEVPRVTLRLTRLETDPTNSDEPIDHRITRTLKELEAMGVDIKLGERPFPPRLVAPASPPPTPPRPTRRVNLDLSLIIALVSDLTHAPLPANEAQAYERFKPLTRVWKSGKLFRSTVINTSEPSSDDEGENEVNEGEDVIKDSHEHSRALALQLLSEMRHSLLDEMATYLKANDQPLEFWTTPEAQQRCSKIVQRIGGASERRRAQALFDPDGEQAFWEGSRFGDAFIAGLVPLRVYPQHVPSTTSLPEPKPTTSYEIFARRLFRTCQILLSPSHAQAQARLKGTNVPLGYATELGPPSDMPLAPSIDTGTPSPSVLAGSRPNTRLTAHTVRSMLWGVSSRVTTLTANRASVRAVLREMKILAGIRAGADDAEGVARDDAGSAGSICEQEKEVGDNGIAVLWVVEPRSLAEQMRSDVVSAGEGVNE